MLELNQELYSEIQNYCKLNGIENINDFILKLIRIGYTSEKYGNKPSLSKISKKEEIGQLEINKTKEEIEKDLYDE